MVVLGGCWFSASAVVVSCDFGVWETLSTMCCARDTHTHMDGQCDGTGSNPNPTPAGRVVWECVECAAKRGKKRQDELQQ